MLKKIKERRLQKRKEKDDKYYCDEKYITEGTKSPIRLQMLDDGISYTKNQQWISAYYTLLIQGALFAFHTVFKGLKVDCLCQIIEVVFLVIASICTAFAGYRLICGYSEKLRDYRIRINKILKNEFEEYIVEGFEKFITCLFKIIFIVSSVFVIFYIIVSCFY